MKNFRKSAFGYSTKCNVRCEHCVAAGEIRHTSTMALSTAKSIISKMAAADVKGISFTAGEPLIFLSEIIELIKICAINNIYSRVVTNGFWAKTSQSSDTIILQLKSAGLSQLRISFSRWHQKNIDRQNIVNAAESCKKAGINYFISFVTDFSKEDEEYEDFLRNNNLKFFPEPVIFAGKAESFKRRELITDYQDNCCPMNPYISPDLDMFACCDAGSHFTNTNFFHLGNLANDSIDELFEKCETNSLYNHIRNMGITTLASFAGFKSRDIIKYRKCELCKLIFNSPDRLKSLEKVSDTLLNDWYR